MVELTVKSMDRDSLYHARRTGHTDIQTHRQAVEKRTFIVTRSTKYSVLLISTTTLPPSGLNAARISRFCAKHNPSTIQTTTKPIQAETSNVSHCKPKNKRQMRTD